MGEAQRGVDAPALASKLQITTEKQTMTIRKCPHCAQLTHLDDEGRAPFFCWSCAALVDFAAMRTPSQRWALSAATALDRALPNPSRLVRAAKISLVAAVPVAALMLLVCNGFNIWIVRDVAAPFLMR